MKKYRTYFFTGILLLFAFLLRIYHLSVLPMDLHIDEAGLGLNAWSIANFGTDRYGHFMPVCPSNFYGEQSAFYTYFCALCVKIGGLNMVTLRFPAVFMGMVTVWFGALMMKEVWGTRGFYTGLTLLGIFPYFIMNCRFALDCNAMLGAVTFSLWLLVRLIKKIRQNPDKKYYGHFALLGISFGIVLYTYIIAAIVIAIFSLSFGMYYLLYCRENRLFRAKQLLFWAIPLLIMVVPLLLTVLIHILHMDAIVTPFFSVPKMTVNRTEEVAFSLSSFKSKLHSLVYPFTTDGKYGSSDRYWTMYKWSVPFIFLGELGSIVRSIREIKTGQLSVYFSMLLFTASEIIMFFLCGFYNYHINGIFIALAFFCFYGIFLLWDRIGKRAFRIAYLAVLFFVYGMSFLGFAEEYYFSDQASHYQVYGGVNRALHLLNETQLQKEIYVVGEVGEFYFLTNPLPPVIFSSYCDELGFVKDYENLHFHEPSSYEDADILVCNKDSGWRNIFSDQKQTGYEYTCLQSDYYCVFIKRE